MQDNSKRLLIIGCIFIGVLVFLLIYNMIRYGFVAGISVFLSRIIYYLIVLLILGIIVLGIWAVLFYKFRYDVVSETKKDYLSEGKINFQKGYLRNLMTSGDELHKPISLGKIVGYSHHSTLKKVPKNFEEQIVKSVMIEGKLKKIDVEKEYWQEEDIFIVKKNFKKILVRCPANLHSELHNDVIMNCINLIKRGPYYYPNVVDLDFDYIDNTIYVEGLLRTNIRYVSNFVPLLEKASGIDQSDRDAVSEMSIVDKVQKKKQVSQGVQ